jgi:hypothetical protein
MAQGSWSGSGVLRKVVAIAGKKKKPRKKVPMHTVGAGGLKVRK